MNLSKILNFKITSLIVAICCAVFLVNFYLNADIREKLPIIEKVADFELINQDSETISLAKFSGKAKVMSFMYSSCVMATMCPLTTRKFKKTQALLEKQLDKKTVFLLISFDPEKDSPGLLKKYGEMYDVDFHNWHFLTGEKKVLDKVIDDYQVIAEKQEGGTYRHAMITFLIDKNNNLRKMYIGNAWDPEDIRRDLITLLGGRYES